jgi:hypothetical protein
MGIVGLPQAKERMEKTKKRKKKKRKIPSKRTLTLMGRDLAVWRIASTADKWAITPALIILTTSIHFYAFSCFIQQQQKNLMILFVIIRDFLAIRVTVLSRLCPKLKSNL